MLLTLTTTHNPATDLGYLLRKNPVRPQSFDLTFGKAHVFYPEAAQIVAPLLYSSKLIRLALCEIVAGLRAKAVHWNNTSMIGLMPLHRF
jgi:hypothetical protein